MRGVVGTARIYIQLVRSAGGLGTPPVSHFSNWEGLAGNLILKPADSDATSGSLVSELNCRASVGVRIGRKTIILEIVQLAETYILLDCVG